MEGKDNKNAIVAVVLSGIILFGWQYFFGTQPYDTSAQQNTVQNTQSTNDINSQKTGENAGTGSINNSESPAQLVKTTLNKDGLEIVINSKLNILSISDSNNKTELNTIFKRFDNKLVFTMDGKKFEPLFNITKTASGTYDLRDNANNISGNLSFADNGSLYVNLTSSNKFTPEFNMVSTAETMEDATKINSFVFLAEGLETINVFEKEATADADEIEEFENKVQWFGLDFNYHLFAFILENKGISKVQIRNNHLKTAPIEPTNSLNYKVVFLRKNYDELMAMGDNLDKAVDFGIWEVVAVPLLRALQYFYTLFNNYGISIILLTICLRFLTFPLQYKSFKSMKKMQVIQPELKKIKEKFKDNPQKQQQETMALFKKSGANPISGCLPMILQMPIFFAFYKVLFTSVELVNAPFYFWITDLSEKDPFYVLPVLMGLAMFLNMKITPSTTTDPAQQKVMMLMPVMFSVFMINLPAGLTLYILVSTIVGMLQQLFVFKKTT